MCVDEKRLVDKKIKSFPWHFFGEKNKGDSSVVQVTLPFKDQTSVNSVTFATYSIC